MHLNRSISISICLLVVLCGEAAAQDESTSQDARSRDGDLYGKITFAGESGPAEAAETEFGLSRLYGGVTGQAGVHGRTQRGPRPGAPELHTVEKGDTLWDLSDKYYGNPWAWPRVWSLNPQIENPHWIYPGDQVRTKPGPGQGLLRDDNSAGGGGMVGRGRLVSQETVFIRDQGYIGDPDEDVWGEVVGAHEDIMLLSDSEVVYLSMREGVDVRLGQRLTVFDSIAEPPKVADSRKPPGEIVKIYGTVRVDGWDPSTRVVRGTVIESVDVIERGFSVGPVGRRFDVVAPTPAEQDVEARILAGLYPTVFFGHEQIVFIDKGSEDGLRSGNRLRIIRRGDTWRRNLSTTNVHARVRAEMGSPDVPKKEITPLHGNDEDFPDEVVGEIRVLRVEDYSAICLVTDTTWGLKQGDRAVAVKGY